MVRTFQLTKALSKLSVIDNMKLGAVGQAGENPFKALIRPIWGFQEREIEARADELLKRFKLYDKRDDYAGELSGGQRKLLEMARALMAEPEVVCLDEPMAGVNPALTQSLLQHVKELKDEGLTVIFVEHDMDVVRDISDWVVVMAEGRSSPRAPTRPSARTRPSSTPTSAPLTRSTSAPSTWTGDALMATGRTPPHRRRAGRRLPAGRQHPQRLQHHASTTASSSGSSVRTVPASPRCLKAVFGLIPVRDGKVTLRARTSPT
jgi:energy-coupling factor transporter ATP-binding protein EcfA2